MGLSGCPPGKGIIKIIKETNVLFAKKDQNYSTKIAVQATLLNPESLNSRLSGWIRKKSQFQMICM